MSDIEPVHVHIASSDVPVSSAPPRRPRRALRTNTFTITAANPVQRVMPESGNRVEGWITSVVGGATSTITENSVTNPGAFAGIAGTAALPAGTYQVTVTVYVSGTTTAADANNMRLVAGGTVISPLAYPAIAGTGPSQAVSIPLQVTLPPGGGTINVTSIGAASGASAVYNAMITVTPDVVVYVAASQADAAAQAGGAAQVNGTDTMPFPVNVTDPVWVSASAAGYPVIVSVVQAFEEPG